MERFVDREKELAALEGQYQRREASLVVVYGRRRVGKTSLISRFGKDKRMLYYLATEESEAQNRRTFQEIAAEFLDQPLLGQANLDRWEAVFEAVAAAAETGPRVILVLDEFQYLGMANPAFPSIFQRIWDTVLSKRNVMVILCGSLTSLMRQQVLNYDSPLYGRRTAQIHMGPIPFRYYHEFFPRKDARELVEFYSVTGGVPKYIELFEDAKDVYAAVEKNVFRPESFLYDEPTFLLQKEVADVANYYSILKAIAAGNRRASAVASRLGVPQTNLSRFLRTLMSLDLVEREVPVTEANPDNSKKSLYYVRDNFLQFWFQFVQPNISYLESGHEELALARLKKSFVDRRVAYVYEDICRDRIWDLCAGGAVSFVAEKVGHWWDSKSAEIDVVALSEGDNAILFGECKFRKEPMGADVLMQLEEKSKQVKWGSPDRREMFALFSISGFSPALEQLAESREDVLLIQGV